MKSIEHARSLDAKGDIIEAIRLYEEAIINEEGNLDDYVNAAVLCFTCSELPHVSRFKLADEQAFINHAWDMSNVVLARAKIRFGDFPELKFWRQYFRFVILGEQIDDNMIKQIAKLSDTLVPYFYLFTSSSGARYKQEASKLYDAIKEGRTEKERYIRSVMEYYINLSVNED